MLSDLLRVDVIILLAIVAAVTYMTRTGGYVVLSRFRNIPPRVEAALEAVPAAVITAIVVPPALSAGTPEILAIGVATAAALRLSAFPVLLLGLATLVAARALGL